MYRDIKNFRITSLKSDKKGWSCSVYKGDHKIGTASYDAENEIYSNDITEFFKNEILSFLKHKRKMIVDNEPLNWSIELAIIALIENEKEYELVKKEMETGNIVLKLKSNDNFVTFNLKDNPENRIAISEAYDVEMYAEEFLKQHKEKFH